MNINIDLNDRLAWLLFESDKRYRIAYGGRGSGKSYGVATRMILHALHECVGLICLRDIQRSISDSSLAVLKRVVHDLELDDYFKSTKHTLECVNGSYFTFKGLQNPENIKSYEGYKYAWVEEAQNVTSEAWKNLLPTIRMDNSVIYITFNPKHDNDPVYSLFLKNNRDDTSAELINWQDNPFFPEALLPELKRDRENNYSLFKHIWEGETLKETDAQVFKGKFEIREFKTPEGVSFYHGADWGFAQDPTAIVRCYIDNDVLYIDQEAVGQGVDTDDLPTLFDNIDTAKKWKCYGDNARPETISYMRKQGFNIEACKKWKGSIEDGIAFLRRLKKIVIHPRCRHTAEEFRLYSYKTNRLTGDVEPVIIDAYNHCIDALRYAIGDLIKENNGVVYVDKRLKGLYL